jgi:hypothetical protein
MHTADVLKWSLEQKGTLDRNGCWHTGQERVLAGIRQMPEFILSFILDDDYRR